MNPTPKNYVGVYFDELLRPDGLGGEVRTYPMTVEEILAHKLPMTVVVGNEAAPGGFLHFRYGTENDKRVYDLALSVSHIVSAHLMMGVVVYSPNANAILAMLLNITSMIHPAHAPQHRLMIVDVNEALRAPAFLALDQRRAFGLQTILNYTGLPTFTETSQNPDAWQHYLMTTLNSFTAMMHSRSPLICPRV